MKNASEENAIAKRLSNLLDTAPELAATEAQALKGNLNIDSFRSATLIDAGAKLKKPNLIQQGIEIIQSIQNQLSQENHNLNYNLANGFHALSLSVPFTGSDWYLTTHSNRQHSRYLFHKVQLSPGVDSDIATQASTNFANLLNSSYRWVEAYDAYIEAIALTSTNGVASAGAIKILQRRLRIGTGNTQLIKKEISRLAGITRNSFETIEAFAGPFALEQIKALISGIKTTKPKSNKPFPSDPFFNFVTKNNLALSPTIHEPEFNKRYWDSLTIYSISEKLGDSAEPHRVPPIFAMLNIMKSDYILCRKLLFDAMNNNLDDIDFGLYSDTLDYAVYGVNPSLLSLVQRSSLDILDKIAVASLSYLNVPGAKRTSFKTAWFSDRKKDEPLSWRPQIASEIELGNTALIALSEIALDLSSEEGYLKAKLKARDSSTHRFTVLHDMGASGGRDSSCIEHYEYNWFLKETLNTLKLVRAALIYFVDMIDIKEDRLTHERKGLYGTMHVPFHHDIRGKGRDGKS